MREVTLKSSKSMFIPEYMRECDDMDCDICAMYEHAGFNWCDCQYSNMLCTLDPKRNGE